MDIVCMEASLPYQNLERRLNVLCSIIAIISCYTVVYVNDSRFIRWYVGLQGGPKNKPLTYWLIIICYQKPLIMQPLCVQKGNTIILWVGIKYSMRHLICEIVSYCVSSCDNIIVIENLKTIKDENFCTSFRLKDVFWSGIHRLLRRNDERKSVDIIYLRLYDSYRSFAPHAQ